MIENMLDEIRADDQAIGSQPRVNDFREGLKAGTVIALGYIPIAIAFGLLAHVVGVSWWIAALMSLTIFAGASQFVGLNMIAAGVTGWEIVMTTLILNLRHFLMSTTLSQRLLRTTRRSKLFTIAFGVTDETFSVSTLQQKGALSANYVLALHSVSFAAWNAGTWVGLALGTSLPQALQSSMGIALYAMFIGLLVPTFKTSAPAITVTAISVATASLLHWVPPFTPLSAGWSIMISTILASTAGAIMFPGKEDPS
jgi:4-azaleucine resistance transporter AzlC